MTQHKKLVRTFSRKHYSKQPQWWPVAQIEKKSVEEHVAQFHLV
ncbi:hypothetical protein [Vibrio parahaemolyticus]|nr:hypothetical protein [Vibrio parahaemolyticus]